MGISWGATLSRKQWQARPNEMVHVLEMGMHHAKEMLFWHVALQMNWWPMSMACGDSSRQGKHRRECDFLQIPTAEEGSAGREGARLEGRCSSAWKKD